MKYILMLFVLSQNVYALLADPETARLKALGGSGVASILINEATILNPASIVFFKNSTALYQRSMKKLEKKSSLRNGNIKEGTSELAIITDTSSSLRGGFSYHYQNQANGKRQQFALSFANNIGKSTGLGLAVRYNKEDSDIIDKNYNQFVIGLTHIMSNDVSLGFNVVDLNHQTPEYFSYRAGIQYNLKQVITLIADFGSGDVKNYERKSFSRYGIQLQAFESLFLRAGMFRDKRLNEQGTSFGLSWAGPKLSLEYSVKKSEIISEKADSILKDEEFLETTVGLTLLF